MALTADHAATDQRASNLTVIRDTSNIQPRSSGKTRLTTRQPRNPQPCPPLASPIRASHTRASHPRPHNPTQASRTHPSHPQLPNNVACNSPTTLSIFEIRSLKSCGFYRGHQRPREGIACEIEEATQNQPARHNASANPPRANQCHSALPTAQVPSSCSTRVRITNSWTGSCESSA